VDVRRRMLARRSRYRFTLGFTVLGAFITVFVVFNLVLQVNAKQVVISDDNSKLVYETNSKDVESFLKSKNIEIGEHDKISVELDDELSDGMIIEIKRAVPIRLKINSVEKEVLTAAKTVGDMIHDQNIRLTPKDDISETLDTPITKDMLIEVKIYDEEEEVVDEEIPYSVIYEDTTTLNEGETRVKTEGKVGRKSVTYKIKKIDEQEVSREKISENVIVEPVNRVILRGIMKAYVAPNGNTYKIKKVYTMSSTAYTNSLQDTGKTEDDPLYGITRSGMKTARGVVAVDPKVIPLMTKLYVEGYGEAIAADTGSAIKGNKIDLFFDTREEAIKYGRKNVKVYVIE